MTNKILVVDNDKGNLMSTSALLEEWGYKADQANGGQEGILKGTSPDYSVILVDHRMPTIGGVEVVREIKKVNSESVLLMYSCDKTREATKEAWAAGATEFIDKDMPLPEFKRAIEKYCDEYHQTRKISRPNQSTSSLRELILSEGLIGHSVAMANVARLIKQFRDINETVLIVGERGTGKEQIAAALHKGPTEQSKLNCSIYSSSSLMESELFGSEKGSFTGSVSSKMGIIEAARGGSVFFDELHHLDLEAQAKLLRTFQGKTIKRVGGIKEYSINFRIIAATQPDIEQRIIDGRFRPDLYDRVNVLRIDVPPLRDRPEDIGLLVDKFKRDFYAKPENVGVAQKDFLTETIRCFERHQWESNVRGLENCVKTLLSTVPDNKIKPKHLNPKQFNIESTRSIVHFSLFRKKQEEDMTGYLQQVLDDCDGNAARAAAIIKVPTSTFYDMIKKYKLIVKKPAKDKDGFARDA